MINTASKRIEWIDTAKGICIILVIIHHISQFLNISYPFFDIFKTFRMPLYFILSGLFFKTYGKMGRFLLKKINNLIIPYIFFYLALSVCVPVLLNRIFGIRIWLFTDYGFEALRFIFSEKIISNPSIWFLLCLFEVNIIFYVIFFFISFSKKRNTVMLVVVSLLFGLAGVFFSVSRIDLPFYIDSALSATPFFLFGWYIKNKSSFLYRCSLDIKYILLFLILFSLMVHFTNGGECYIMSNFYGNTYGILQLYPYGIIGALLVFELSRYVGTIKIISFIGRYSIIVLCIHSYAIQLCRTLFFNNTIYPIVYLFLIAVMTVMLCYVMIYPIKKWLPYFTAQKNIFKV